MMGIGLHDRLLLHTALLAGIALAASGCGGSGGSASQVLPGGGSGAGLNPTLSLAQARAQAAESGTGNPSASLNVVGTVSGTLQRDVAKAAGKSSGKLEPAAQATIATDRGAYSTRADANGQFSLNLPAGTYTLTIAQNGFETFTIEELPVLANANVDVTASVSPLAPLGADDVDDTSDPARPVSKAYVGSGRCRACHTSHFEAFSSSRHANPIRWINDAVDASRGFGVVADWSPDPGSTTRLLSFTDSAVGTRPVRIELRKTADNRYFATLLNTTNGKKFEFEARRTHGGTGDWKQRFQTKIGASWYTLPIQYNELEADASKVWVKYNLGDWFDSRGDVRAHERSRNGIAETVRGPAQSKSYDRQCFGCHGTAQEYRRLTSPEAASGEGFEGDWTVEHSSLTLSCENCHGPGFPHADTQNPNDIVNPSKTAARQNKLGFFRANEVCGQCHVRGHSNFSIASAAAPGESASDQRVLSPLRPDGTPYKLNTDLLATAYDVSGDGKYWDRDTTRNQVSLQHHQQWLDAQQGAHGFQAASVTCWDCHDPHGTKSAGREHQLLASADDNALCLRCHGKDGTAYNRYLLPGETSTDASVVAVTAHTGHPYDPQGTGGRVSSRCTACHMPLTASSALKYDITDHTMRVVKPVESLDMFDDGGNAGDGRVIPHSCASSAVGCHNSEGFPGGDFLVGTGDVRQEAGARTRLAAATNAYESKFGTRKAVGTDVAARLGAMEGTVTLGGLPMKGARVTLDRGESYDETGEDGTFRLYVAAGTYNVFAQHPSFKTTSLEGVRVVQGAVSGGNQLQLQALADGEHAFVGSQKCKLCHAETYSRWQKTLHNRGIRYIDSGDDRDGGLGVVADFGPEGVGRVIKSTESDFAALGTAEIRLGVQDGVYTVTLVNGDGSVAATYTPSRTYGGGRGDWKQRFMVEIGDSHYILPIQWSERGPQGAAPSPRWLTYNLSNWFDTATKVFSAPARFRSFEYNCTGCHATGLEAEFRAATGEVLTSFTEMNTGCEKCHGAGGSHYRTGDVTKIVDPDKLASIERKMDLCGHCHSRGESTHEPDGVHGSEYGISGARETFAGSGIFELAIFSVLDVTAPGTGPAVFTTFLTPDIDVEDGRYWNSATWTVTSGTADPAFVPSPDQRRTSIKHHQQANDFPLSRHFTFGVTCWRCHDPHGSDNKANLTLPDGNLIVDGQVNETGNLCLSCHGPSGSLRTSMKFTSVENLRKHFQGGFPSHAANESLFACTTCHMPKTAKTVEAYDIHAHTFQAIKPQVSLDMGLAGGNDNTDPTRQGQWTYDKSKVIPNACTGCHGDRTITSLDFNGSMNALRLAVSLYDNWVGNGGGKVE